jgi:hypothetical protein
MPDSDPLLTAKQASERVGLKPATWRYYRKRGYVPPPDDPDNDPAIPQERRRPRWLTSTVDQFRENRLGQGRRTDRAAAQAGRRRRMAEELAAPVSAPAAVLQDWLVTNYKALITVAEALADDRDALLAAAPGREREHLTEAINQAEEAIGGRPSRSLARAVVYAMFLLRLDGPVRVPDGLAVREALARYGWLRAEFGVLTADDYTPR